MEAVKQGDFNHTVREIKAGTQRTIKEWSDSFLRSFKNLEDKLKDTDDLSKGNAVEIKNIKERIQRVEDKTEDLKDDFKDKTHEIERRIDNDVYQIKLDISAMKGSFDNFINTCEVTEKVTGEKSKRFWESLRFWMTLGVAVCGLLIGKVI